MRLQTLSLENYQGVKSLRLEFGGQNAVIYGENGTGKTTVFNAFTWLLTGKDSSGTKGYTPKTNDSQGGEVHNLDHSAEAVLTLEGGRQVTLRKVYHEVYKKKRGHATAEFSGNTVDYYINGVPTKEKEYTSYILEQFGGEEHLKMLTMPEYFLSMMEPKKRRQALSELFGDVTDDEVIQSSDELAELPAFLLIPGTADQRYSVAEYRKITEARRREVNRQLDKLPDRIDEASRSIPENVEELSEDEINRDLLEIEERLRQLAKQRSDLSADTVQSNLQKRIAEARVRLEQARGEHLASENTRLADQRRRLQQLMDEAHERRRNSTKSLMDSDRLREQHQRMMQARENLLEEWKQVSATRWDAQKEICPTCGQTLPADKVEQMRGDFNEQRSRHLAEISRRGKLECNQDMIDNLQKKIDETQSLAEKERLAGESLDGQIAQLRSEVIAVPFEETEDYLRYASVLEDLKEQQSHLNQEGSTRELEQIDKWESEWRTKRSDLQNQLFSMKTAKTQKARIKELEREEKNLASEFERLEQGLYLCECFIRRQVEMIDERINRHFSTIRFKLFREQNNGGLADCCEALVPSKNGAMVPYQSANTAAKVTSGLEVAGVLSKRFGISAPVFVDGAESVTPKTIAPSLEVMKCAGIQVILLKVSETDDTLRMEVIQNG